MWSLVPRIKACTSLFSLPEMLALLHTFFALTQWTLLGVVIFSLAITLGIVLRHLVLNCGLWYQQRKALDRLYRQFQEEMRTDQEPQNPPENDSWPNSTRPYVDLSSSQLLGRSRSPTLAKRPGK